MVESEKTDVLIVGNRGMGALKRAFLGSVSDYCVQHASCPVIVVKRPPVEEKSSTSAGMAA